MNYDYKFGNNYYKYYGDKGIKSTTDYLIWISKKDYKLNLFKGADNNFRLINSYPCTIGAYSTPTITGEFEYHEKIDKKYPLSLSYQNVTENLKNKLNFKGLTFTDDLQMGALAKQYAWDEIVIQAINAGNDVLVISNNFDYTPDIVQKTLDIVLKAISDGKISEDRIDEAYARIIKTKQFLCAKD